MRNPLTRHLFTCFTVLFSILFQANVAEASHALGAELTYRALGNNQYRLKLTFYRDCAGSVQIGNIDNDIAISSSCFNTSVSLQLQDPPVYGPPLDQYLQDYEIPVYCQSAGTTCSSSSNPYPGIQEIVFEGTVTLPPCSDYVLSYSESARSTSIQTIQNPGSADIYVEAFLNSVDAPNNSSPQFDDQATGVICLNQPNSMIHTATDVDGDLLVYSLYTPLDGPGLPVTYVAGYSSSNPINNTNLTFSNGILDITPSEQTVAVMGVKVEEYRNGVLVGSVMRDFQVVVVASCPQYPEGLFQTDTLGGFDSDSMVICTSDTIDISVFLGNTDPNQTYHLEVSNLEDFPGATFTVEPDTANEGSVVGHFTWVPDLSNINIQNVVFHAFDENCPVIANSNFTYKLYFKNIVADATTSVTGIACSDSVLLEPDLDDPSGPVHYLWDDGDTSSTYWAMPGNYSVTITDSAGCSGSDSYVVYYNNYPIANFEVDPVCLNDSIHPNDLSFNYADNGVTPLELTNWNWDFGDGVGLSVDTFPAYRFSTAGIHTVTLVIENENGCLDTIQKDVTIYPLADYDVSADVTCIGLETQFNNSTTIQSGSIVSWSWELGDAGATSSDQSPVYQYPTIGEYEVTLTAVTDLGCESDTTFNAIVTDLAHASFSYAAIPNCGQENLQIHFTNESDNAVAYLWDFENNLTDTATNPVYNTPSATGPVVTLRAYAYPGQLECSDDTIIDITDVFLTVDFDTINAGNVITPNGDGLNDCLAPFWHEAYAECYRLRIWDRWGMSIYDSNDVENGQCWPGTDRKGQPVSNGTFYFVAEVNSYTRTGHVVVAK